MGYELSPFSISTRKGTISHIYHWLSSPLCRWNGKEIALVGAVYQEFKDELRPIEASFVRLSNKGKFLAPENFLGEPDRSLKSYQEILWNGSTYVVAGQGSLVVVEP